MKAWVLGLGALLGGIAGFSAAAETTTEMLFQHKHWEVELVSFDDGSFSCLAEVDAVTDSFTIWTYADQSIRVQFYSTDWEFGEGDTANMEIEVDRRGAWEFTNAELYQNSVLFDLPDSDAGVRFLVEVSRGTRLYLRTEAGEGVKDYSLSGSQASMNALVECSNAISGSTINPFN